MTGAEGGIGAASSIIVRSTSSTAVGSSFDDVLRASIASWKVGKLTTPSALRGLAAAQSFRSARGKASVPSLPTSRCARLTLPSAARAGCG